MLISGMRLASISSVIALGVLPCAVAAQEPLDENIAIDRALAREGIAARDASDRAASRAGGHLFPAAGVVGAADFTGR